MPTILPCVPGHYEYSYGDLLGPYYYDTDPLYSLLKCFCGVFQITAEGGDAGGGISFALGESCGARSFKMQGTRGGIVADMAEVWANGVRIWSSDCAATAFDSGWIAVPAGTTTMQANVVALCAGGSDTYWYFNFAVFCD